MLILVTISTILWVVPSGILTDQVSFLLTYIALILALEDSYNVMAKRYQKRKNRVYSKIILCLMACLEILTIILVIGSLFTNMLDQNTMYVVTIFAILTTVGVLLIRKDAMTLL